MVIPITQVSRGILRVGPLDTGHPSAPTSPYIILGNGCAMVAEPGEDGQVAPLLHAIKAAGVGVEGIKYVWASHIHFHHIQGLPTLLPQLPNAKFLVHPRGAPHLIEPTRLIQSTIEAWGDKCYGPFTPIPADRIMSVEDGQVIDLGGRELEIIHAPGHAPHHMGLFDRQTRSLFPGDSTHPPAPGAERGHHDVRPPLFDVEKFVQSLRKYQTYKPVALFTFSEFGQSFAADKTLEWAIEDILVIERICRSGMKQKLGFKEIVQKVDEYDEWVGTRPLGGGGGAVFSSGGLFGLINYLSKKEGLTLPAGSAARMRG